MSEILLKKLLAQYTTNVYGEYCFKEFPRRRNVEVGSDISDSLFLFIISETPWVESI